MSHTENQDVTYYSGHVKRPKQAPVGLDGLSIENGETVYLIDGDGTPLTVVETPKEGCYQSIVVQFPNGSKTGFDPPRLTRTKPKRACKPIVWCDGLVECHGIHEHWFAECEFCGAILGEAVSESQIHNILPNYCACCGAKIIKQNSNYDKKV